MAERFLVVGLGRFGSALVEALAAGRREVVAVDSDMRVVGEIKDRVSYAAQLDATDPEALRSIEAERCQVAVVAIGEDFEAGALTVAALKEIGVPRIIARARSARHARILVSAGATETVEIETEMGRRLGGQLAGNEPRGP
jgi:trk system potassium uptake protein TrkA